MSAPAGSGPEGLPRAIVLTFDNLGEASALQRGTWDARAPIGQDLSVTRALPRLLDALERRDLRATFFVEAINCELNPRALHAIAERGHELGVHGWRHEPWNLLDEVAERELLARSTRAFADAGLPVRAFRPPGGEGTPTTEALLRAHGYAWWSPVGDAPEVRAGLALVPFSWRLVDAYHLMDRFAELRAQRGDAVRPMPAPALGDQFLRWVSDDLRGVQTVILHPFLTLDERWFGQVRRLLAAISRLRADRQTWVGPGGEFADWLTRRLTVIDTPV